MRGRWRDEAGLLALLLAIVALGALVLIPLALALGDLPCCVTGGTPGPPGPAGHCTEFGWQRGWCAPPP